jgi:DNA-binding phage protein
MDERKAATARRMHADSANTAADIARALGVSRATLYRSLKQQGRPLPSSGTLHQAVNTIPEGV